MSQVGRRRFLVATGALVVAPLTTASQPAAQQRAYRIGILSVAAPEDLAVFQGLKAFRQGLREHGWVEGQNVTLEHRYSSGKLDLLPGLAADLVRSKVDVILAAGGPAAPAAKKATSTIPIVFSAVLDPVGSGLVSSLARPGGNVTGVSFFAGPEVAGKALQLLVEVVPTVTWVAVLQNPSNIQHPFFVKQAEVAAQAVGVELRSFEARDLDALNPAFTSMRQAHAGAVVVLADAMYYVHRKRIADLSANNRLPAIYGQKEHVDAGGLMAYGPGFADRYRRAGIYVGRILKGSQPGELPVEQPTKFELVVNLATAKTLGLRIPQSILLRADEVIE